MKKIIVIILTLCMIFTFAACSNGSGKQSGQPNTPAGTEKTLDDLDPVVITFAHCDSEDSYPAKGAKAALDAITERSGGKITFEYYPGGQLGEYVELTESMATGGLDMGMLDPTLMTEYAPEFPMLIQPFIIKDYDMFSKVLALDAVKDSEAALAKNNIYTLGYIYCGFRAMCTQKLVTKVADCKGIIIRSPEADIYMNTLKRLGFSPTPMAFTEMYSAMKAGVIQGAEPAVSAIYDDSLYEVCPFVLQSNHMFSFENIVISNKLWDSLDPLYQGIISKAVAEACAQEQKDMENGEQWYFDELAKKGCTVSQWDNYQELVDLFAPTWTEAANGIGGKAPAMLEQILALN